MKALAYLGPDKKALQGHPSPDITSPSDAIVKMTRTTIRGTEFNPATGC
jgi:alcohol dehydrogenase